MESPLTDITVFGHIQDFFLIIWIRPDHHGKCSKGVISLLCRHQCLTACSVTMIHKAGCLAIQSIRIIRYIKRWRISHDNLAVGSIFLVSPEPDASTTSRMLEPFVGSLKFNIKRTARSNTDLEYICSVFIRKIYPISGTCFNIFPGSVNDRTDFKLVLLAFHLFKIPDISISGTSCFFKHIASATIGRTNYRICKVESTIGSIK